MFFTYHLDGSGRSPWGSGPSGTVVLGPSAPVRFQADWHADARGSSGGKARSAGEVRTMYERIVVAFDGSDEAMPISSRWDHGDSATWAGCCSGA